MDDTLSGWWILNKTSLSHLSYWWWPYIVSILMRMESIRQMGYMHPDGLLPPKNDWLDDGGIQEWEKQCEKLRKEKSDQEGFVNG